MTKEVKAIDYTGSLPEPEIQGADFMPIHRPQLAYYYEDDEDIKTMFINDAMDGSNFDKNLQIFQKFLIKFKIEFNQKLNYTKIELN